MNLSIGASRSYAVYQRLRPSHELARAIHLMTKNPLGAREKYDLAVGSGHLGQDKEEGQSDVHSLASCLGLHIVDDLKTHALVMRYIEALKDERSKDDAAQIFKELPGSIRAYLTSLNGRAAIAGRFTAMTDHRMDETLRAVMRG